MKPVRDEFGRRPAIELRNRPRAGFLKAGHGGYHHVTRISPTLLASFAALSLGTGAFAQDGNSGTPQPRIGGESLRGAPARGQGGRARRNGTRQHHLQASASQPDPCAEAPRGHQGAERRRRQGPRQRLGHGVPAGWPHAGHGESRQAAHRRQGRHARPAHRRRFRRWTREARAVSSTWR